VYCEQNSFDAVIHCAALAKMGECENDTVKAFDVKTVGTLNLVCAIRKIEIYKLLKRVSFSALFYKNK
jgi:dTDP-4-dehydrorhamnose reductase